MGRAKAVVFSVAMAAGAGGLAHAAAGELVQAENHAPYRAAVESCADYLPLAGPIIGVELPVTCLPFITDFTSRPEGYILPSRGKFINGQNATLASSDFWHSLTRNAITAIGGAVGLAYAMDRVYVRRQANRRAAQHESLPVQVSEEGTDSRILTKTV